MGDELVLKTATFLFLISIRRETGTIQVKSQASGVTQW